MVTLKCQHVLVKQDQIISPGHSSSPSDNNTVLWEHTTYHSLADKLVSSTVRFFYNLSTYTRLTSCNHHVNARHTGQRSYIALNKTTPPPATNSQDGPANQPTTPRASPARPRNNRSAGRSPWIGTTSPCSAAEKIASKA